MKKESLIKIGNIFNSKRYGCFIIIDKIKNGLFKIKFNNTGYITNAYYYAIKNGEVKDNLVPSVVGIGCLGYATKKGNEKEYRLWKSMLNRCYNKNDKCYKNYGEKGVFVCERWHRFDYFLEDIPKIKWYDEEDFKNGLLQLDKDIFSIDNKVYSLETCCFVNSKTNANNREYSYQKYFIAISPEGVTYKDKSIRGFARLHNLQATHISACLKEKEKQHKGWKFYYINQEDK